MTLGFKGVAIIVGNMNLRDLHWHILHCHHAFKGVLIMSCGGNVPIVACGVNL
jgi:hypothetical protein